MAGNRKKNVDNNRISLMIPTLGGGGAERTFLNLAGGLQEAGYQVDLILKQVSGEYISQVPDGVNLVDLKASRMVRTLPGLIRYLKSRRPRVLLAGLELPNLISVMAQIASGEPTKVIVSIHGVVSQGERFFLPHRSLERLLMRLLYLQAAQIVAVSKGTAKDLSSYLGIPLSRICVIYNPVLLAEVLEKAQEPVQHPWFDPGQPPVILSVGRLNPVKDYPTMIRSFYKVLQHIPARLLILGEGEQREELESLVRQLRLQEYVSLPGFQQNPYGFMRAADVFTLSSLHETFGHVLIEAMACGCPVVSTDCPGGVGELVDYGKYGHLVPVGDKAAMAQAILDVLNGDVRKPPPEWLHQFEYKTVLQQYVELF